MKLLVTGGAGYVGSVLASRLISAGHAVAVLDNLSSGHRDAVPAGAQLVIGDVSTDARRVLDQTFDAVVHMAALSLVAESEADPAGYWRQNLGATVALLAAMQSARVPRIIFSSTAAVYGNPGDAPITESSPPRPESAYGSSKLAADVLLAEHARLSGIAAVSLRYFNVAGACQHEGRHWLGERHRPETHLIPTLLWSALRGGPPVSINGPDYPTRDGTCVRDYVHVSDVAAAHLLALEACSPGRHLVYNLGSGAGFSNLDVIATCSRVTGRDIPVRTAQRRPGDPAVLIASSDRIRTDLGWQAERDLEDMVRDAWAFMLSRSSGPAEFLQVADRQVEHLDGGLLGGGTGRGCG
jgi:UDP-glucose 4-epimerase